MLLLLYCCCYHHATTLAARIALLVGHGRLMAGWGTENEHSNNVERRSPVRTTMAACITLVYRVQRHPTGYDVAANICQALPPRRSSQPPRGKSRWRRRRQRHAAASCRRRRRRLRRCRRPCQVPSGRVSQHAYLDDAESNSGTAQSLACALNVRHRAAAVVGNLRRAERRRWRRLRGA